MNVDLADRLRQLQGATCSNVDVVEYEPAPSDGIQPIGMAMIFSDGTKVSSTYWRLIKSGKPRVSSFDHRQTYGLPEPIDAVRLLREELHGNVLVTGAMDEATGDLRFRFRSGATLQVFNFTSFEDWEVTFPDGTGQLSNYALQA